MKYSTAAIVPTNSASRYLQQLCKHWADSLTVACTTKEGKITLTKNLRGKGSLTDATVKSTRNLKITGLVLLARYLDQRLQRLQQELAQTETR